MTGRKLRMPAYLTQTGSLFGYLFSMMLSRLLVGEPASGGAMFLCGRLALSLTAGLMPEEKRLISRKVRLFGGWMTILLLAVNLALMTFYPPSADAGQDWRLFGVILTVILAEAFGNRLVRVSAWHRMPLRRFFLLYWSMMLLLSLAGGAVLLTLNQGRNGWMLLLGYLMAMGAEVYDQLKAHAEWTTRMPAGEDSASHARELMKRANVFAAYELLTRMMIAAMQVTLALLFTMLTLTAESLPASLGISMAAALAARELTELLFNRRARKKETDPINVVTVGLFLWLYGLLTAYLSLKGDGPEIPSIYMCIAVCTGGVFLCMSVLGRLEHVMQEVGSFTAGTRVAGYDSMRLADWTAASLAGQMLTLTALTVMTLISGGRSLEGMLRSLRPMMALPALVMVAAALLASLRFPLTKRYNDKLERLLDIRQAGTENKPLEDQLEKVVTAKRKRPLGLSIVMLILRPFFHHTLQGVENLRRDDENPMVFLCNHGEVYGPIVGMLFIPAPVRPWVISDIFTDPDEIAGFVYRFTVSNFRWLPEKWKMPVCRRIVAPLSMWVMEQAEAIPVYRNKPMQLMKTFRMSADALQSGDNLLIFPENPDAVELKKGYVHEGLGELFSGFALLAQVYWKRTGKRCRFIPMYCHKHMRTMTFGEAIVYDPENDPQAERERISAEASRVMKGICAAEDERWRQRTEKLHKTRKTAD